MVRTYPPNSENCDLGKYYPRSLLATSTSSKNFRWMSLRRKTTRRSDPLLPVLRRDALHAPVLVRTVNLAPAVLALASYGAEMVLDHIRRPKPSGSVTKQKSRKTKPKAKRSTKKKGKHAAISTPIRSRRLPYYSTPQRTYLTYGTSPAGAGPVRASPPRRSRIVGRRDRTEL